MNTVDDHHPRFNHVMVGQFVLTFTSSKQAASRQHYQHVTHIPDYGNDKATISLSKV